MARRLWLLACLTLYSQLSYPLYKFCGAKRFCEEIICPSAKCNDSAVIIVKRSENDDRYEHEMWICTQNSAHLKTVGVRHHKVKQDNVRFDRVRCLMCF
jgi:hypothetical protein